MNYVTVGRLIHAYLSGNRKPSGYYFGRVERVDRKGKPTIRLYGGDGPKKNKGYNGKRIKLNDVDLSRSNAVYRGKLVPLN